MYYHKQNYKYKSGRITIKCVALLFVIYAFADITVLQAYCGNEAIGIPPSHHFSPHHHEQIEQTTVNHNDDSQHSDEESNEDSHEHLSFSSTYIMAQTFLFEPNLLFCVEKITNPANSYHSKYSNSALTNLFRPPRIA